MSWREDSKRIEADYAGRGHWEIEPDGERLLRFARFLVESLSCWHHEYGTPGFDEELDLLWSEAAHRGPGAKP